MNDSIWATILGICKTFGVTPEYALYEMSYVNTIMYSRALPTYESKDESNEPYFDESKDACKEANFESFETEEVVRITDLL